MDFSLKEAFATCIMLVVAGLLFSALGNFLEVSSRNVVLDVGESFFSSNVNNEIIGKDHPVLTVSNIKINKGDSRYGGDLTPDLFRSYVTATDSRDGDVIDSLEVAGRINVNQKGTYRVRFTIENSLGLKTTYIKTVVVD